MRDLASRDIGKNLWIFINMPRTLHNQSIHIWSSHKNVLLLCRYINHNSVCVMHFLVAVCAEASVWLWWSGGDTEWNPARRDDDSSPWMVWPGEALSYRAACSTYSTTDGKTSMISLSIAETEKKKGNLLLEYIYLLCFSWNKAVVRDGGVTTSPKWWVWQHWQCSTRWSLTAKTRGYPGSWEISSKR